MIPMKTSLAIPFVVLGAAAMMLTGGCVEKSKYDEALAANRRMQAQLDQTMANLQQMQAKIDALNADLRDRDAVIAKLKQDIALLETQNRAWAEKFDALKAEYDKLAAGGQAPILSTIALPVQVDQALKELARAYPDLIEYLPEYGMVKIKTDLTFAKGSTDVQPEAQKALAKLAEICNTDAALKLNVYIAGHTDDIPIRKPDTRAKHPDNWFLSAHRSIAVKDVLEKGGLSAPRIGVLGFGEYHPVAPNAPGNKGNALNRRVEIWLVPANRFLTAASSATAAPAPAPAGD